MRLIHWSENAGAIILRYFLCPLPFVERFQVKHGNANVSEVKVQISQLDGPESFAIQRRRENI
jgi:hypothetical protein